MFTDEGEQTRFGSALPVESLEPELCKEGVHVFAHRVIVVATRAIGTIGVIEGDNPNDLPTVSGIITWEIKAIQIFVGISRWIFFIARHNGEYDIDSYETGTPTMIALWIGCNRLNCMLAFADDRYCDTEVSGTHIAETTYVVWLTYICAAVHAHTCPLIIDVAGTPVRNRSLYDNIYRQRFNNNRLIVAWRGDGNSGIVRECSIGSHQQQQCSEIPNQCLHINTPFLFLLNISCKIFALALT